MIQCNIPTSKQTDDITKYTTYQNILISNNGSLFTMVGAMFMIVHNVQLATYVLRTLIAHNTPLQSIS